MHRIPTTHSSRQGAQAFRHVANAGIPEIDQQSDASHPSMAAKPSTMIAIA
jgi:hypothetical protein